MVVWYSEGSNYGDGDGSSIQGQRFASDGSYLGSQFQVNTYTTSWQGLSSDVSLDSDGDFVVVWQTDKSNYGDPAGSVQGQRFASNGSFLGSQFQVNTYTTGGQSYPMVNLDSDGDFVVTWHSYGDGSNSSVQGQRFASNGSFLGSQFQVNTYTFQDQYYADISVDNDGDFVVVWDSFRSDGDTSYNSIQGQHFGSDGSSIRSQFQVNSYTTLAQVNPAVSVNSEGDYVIVWKSWGSYGDDTSGSSIQFRQGSFKGTYDFQVNTCTTSNQKGSAVGVDSDGDFVVVWESNFSNYGDLSGYSIQGQRFDSNGNFQGSQFQVNTYTTNKQYAPSVSVDSDRDFVVVWESLGSSLGDANGLSIQGQRYNSSGSFLGSQFQVNTYTTDHQRNPTVSVGIVGNFVVVWESEGSNYGDTDAASIQGQRFAADGSFLGSQFQVNTYVSGYQSEPVVSVDSDGDFVVAWNSSASNYGDVSLASVQGQRFASNGSFRGSQFQVNTYTLYAQKSPDVSTESNGDFVVVWHSFGSNNDTDGFSIKGQRFASNGSFLGSEFQVNTYTTGHQFNPEVSVDSDGDFVVAWDSYGSNYGDVSSTSVQGQRFTSNGSFLDSQFQINTFMFNAQNAPDVGMDDDGDFAVIWQSAGSFYDDKNDMSIQCRLYKFPATAVPAISAPFIIILLILFGVLWSILPDHRNK
ncbi:hypothetical protein ACFL27_25135 [candidate division CSSED10-310 bacterium]|uniref:Uncharacterized protein n=1 Tax=candidate division CSSED10-310 bacterium TaxID=2855610 RepID=A0ABV6Z4Y8_UNCC1